MHGSLFRGPCCSVWCRSLHSHHLPTEWVLPSCCLQIDQRIRFRYMRFWVESGHQKAGLRVSPMLRMAMDFLDKELNRFSCLKVRLFTFMD